VAGLAAAAFLAMAIGTAVSEWQAIRARRALAVAQAANVTAQAREADLRTVLEFVEGRVFAALRPKGRERGLGPDVTLRQAIDAALPAVAQTFADQPLAEARLRLTLGASYFYVGEPRTAAEQYEASRALNARHRGPDDPDTLTSMNNLAVSYQALGRRAEALKLFEEALVLKKAKLGPDHPDTLYSMHNLAAIHQILGRHAEALKLHEETLALRRAKLDPDHPDVLGSMSNLAITYHELGRHVEALKLQKEALTLRRAKLGPDHPETLTTMNNLAVGYQVMGRNDEALTLLEETLALMKAKLGPDHPDTLWFMNSLANCYRSLGRWDEALAACDRAIALGTDNHDAWNHAAILWARTGDRAGYRGHCRRMLDRFGPTTDPIIAEQTARVCLFLPLDGPGQDAACDLADRAVALARGHQVEPWAEATRGLAAYRRGHFADAVAWADRSLAWSPGEWSRELPCHLVRAMALTRLGRLDEAGAARARASDPYRTKVASLGGRADGGGWHDQVICVVLRREAEAYFLDRDFPADPFARRTDPQTGARPPDMEPRLIAP
jgi:tetratricopeptide (TPR) repeat protein